MQMMWGLTCLLERDRCVAGDLEIIYTNVKRNMKLRTVTMISVHMKILKSRILGETSNM